MHRLRPITALAVLFLFVSLVRAADEPLPLSTAQGTVDKADKESLTIRPRAADGKFQKALTLKLTGTSRITTLVPQNRAGKVILTQRDAEAKDLESGLNVAIVYTTLKEGPVLLTAVVVPAK